MTLAEATATYLALFRYRKHQQPSASVRERVLALLTSYYSPNTTANEIEPEELRDFLSRWYLDHAYEAKASGSDRLPEPADLLKAIDEFFIWADQSTGAGRLARCVPLMDEMQQTLPRAFEITEALAKWLAQRGGAFSFPEYLTSFEEGGHSEYDIDAPDKVGAIDGYFKITRVEDSMVEAEELISGNRVSPIVFPPDIAALLGEGYIINLEVVRSTEGWVITGCGFAYPPGTSV